MQVDFLTVLVAVVSLIIIAIPGFIVVKTKLIDGKVSAAFSALVLYVCAPAQVYMGFQKEKFSAEIGVNMLIVAAVALVAVVAVVGATVGLAVAVVAVVGLVVCALITLS